MKIDTFIIKFREALEIKENNLSLETEFQDLDEWDSMTALMLISFVAEEFKIVLDLDDILSLTTIQSLIERIGQENIN